jgi:membrane protein YqaA with SNARE-associated domain
VLLQKLTNFLVAFGPVGLLLMAFIDSAGLPVAGGLDALLIFLAVKNPRGAWLYAAICVAGSTAGNVALYFTARRGGRRFLERSATPGRAQRFRAWFQRFGMVTVFIPALLPIPMPLKLFVISAGALRSSFPVFVVAILLARVPRYFGEAWLGVKLGEGSTAFLRQHAWDFVIAALALFILLYLLVLASERWRMYRQAHRAAGTLR